MRQLSRGLHYKALQIDNLQEIDRFCIKLVSSDLDKHASLLQSLYIMNL